MHSSRSVSLVVLKANKSRAHNQRNFRCTEAIGRCRSGPCVRLSHSHYLPNVKHPRSLGLWCVCPIYSNFFTNRTDLTGRQ